jgi:hypothetical protein
MRPSAPEQTNQSERPPDSRAAEQRGELAAPHSITSLARKRGSYFPSFQISVRHPVLPVTLKCSQMADYLPPNTLSWLGESDYALARYRAFLKHARKPSSHDE